MQTLASGLTAPTAVDWTPDGRMLIAEKTGHVKLVPAGEHTASLLLDISGHVNDYWDRGLEDIEVDSDFASSRYVYLLYVYDPPPEVDYVGPKASRLTRITLNPDNTLANPTSPETVLLGTDSGAPCGTPSNTLDCIPADRIGHVVGSVKSASDGTLFVGSGDAAEFSGPATDAFRTYDERSFAGKVMHVDRNGNGLPGHPFCSADTDLTHVCTKIHAKGFRNPFRFSLRPDGKVIAGDVGWNAIEEIDLLRPGGNYGWPCYEGNSQNGPYESFPDTDGSQPCPALYALEGGPDAVDPPLYQYGHDGESAAVVVGPTYPGGAYPAGYEGDVFFGDYSKGFIKRLRLDGSGAVTGVIDFAQNLYGFVDLELSSRGNLTLVAFGDGSSGTGSVQEITRDDLVAEAAATPDEGPAPLTVQLDSSASQDARGQQLTYEWDFGDGSPPSSDPAPSHTYPAGSYEARLTVTNEDAETDTDTVTIQSGFRPSVEITTPSGDYQYQDGMPVALIGEATDQQDGDLDGDSLEWHVIVRHLTHTHSLGKSLGGTAEFTPVTDHDIDAFYEVTLTATNSLGLKSTDTLELHPQTAWFGVYSYPEPDAPVTRGAFSGPAPLADWSAVGFETTVAAEPSFDRGDTRWVFDGWTDGGSRSHPVAVPADGLVLVALYHPEPLPPDPDPPPPEPEPEPQPQPQPQPAQQALSSVGAPVPIVDSIGPKLEVDRGRRKLRRLRRLSGRVSDSSGVTGVDVALLRHLGKKSCAWLARKRGRVPLREGACSTPVWNTTRLTAEDAGWRWSKSLKPTLGAGRYTVLVRARDRFGNSSSLVTKTRVRRAR